jgi:hypothetical protein
MEEKEMKKEFLLFSAIFIFLAISLHFEAWTSYPLEHIQNLPNAGAYGFGPLHAVIFPLIIYILIGIPRLIIKLIFRKKN